MRHVQAPARARECGLVIFAVEDPAAGGHPLHVARSDHTARTRAIVMRDAAFESERHRFETAMRMRADAAPMVRRRIDEGRLIIEQEERAEFACELGVARDVAVHEKPLTHPACARRGNDDIDAALDHVGEANIDHWKIIMAATLPIRCGLARDLPSAVIAAPNGNARAVFDRYVVRAQEQRFAVADVPRLPQTGVRGTAIIASAVLAIVVDQTSSAIASAGLPYLASIVGATPDEASWMLIAFNAA